MEADLAGLELDRGDGVCPGRGRRVGHRRSARAVRSRDARARRAIGPVRPRSRRRPARAPRRSAGARRPGRARCRRGGAGRRRTRRRRWASSSSRSAGVATPAASASTACSNPAGTGRAGADEPRPRQLGVWHLLSCFAGRLVSGGSGAGAISVRHLRTAPGGPLRPAGARPKQRRSERTVRTPPRDTCIGDPGRGPGRRRPVAAGRRASPGGRLAGMRGGARPRRWGSAPRHRGGRAHRGRAIVRGRHRRPCRPAAATRRRARGSASPVPGTARPRSSRPRPDGSDQRPLVTDRAGLQPGLGTRRHTGSPTTRAGAASRIIVAARRRLLPTGRASACPARRATSPAWSPDGTSSPSPSTTPASQPTIWLAAADGIGRPPGVGHRRPGAELVARRDPSAVHDGRRPTTPTSPR